MYNYGLYLGNRYKDFPNVAWIMGGDCDVTNYLTKLDTCVDGIKHYMPNALIDVDNERHTLGTTYCSLSWLNLNEVYAGYEDIPTLSKQARAHVPAKPFFMIEGYYENDDHAPTMQMLRAQNAWTVLMGGTGSIFGNYPLYGFGYPLPDTAWFSALSAPGAIYMQNLYNIFTSYHWWKFIPDTSHTVLTSGYGTFGTSNYSTAASTSDSSSIIAYLPTQRSITINPAVLKGDSIHVWWYNPSNGIFTDRGMYSKVSRSYNQPSAGDWVMVIDGKEFDSTHTNIDDTRNLPHEFNLYQNYPNPSNPFTNIVYTLPRRVHVTLDLYNCLGQLIGRIVDETQNAGYHQVQVNGRQLTSGVYLYRLQAGEFVQTKKLILLK